MAQNLYNVVFRGMLTGAKSEDEVKVELAALFKASADKIETLFSGKPVVIKRNIDAATATKFRAAFERAGAFCELVKADEAPDQPEPAASEAAPAQQPASPAQPDESGAEVEEVTAAPPPPAAEPDEPSADAPAAKATEATDDAEADSIARSGDPNGTVLERDVSANLSQLAIDESDRPHQPHEDVPPPQVDIGSLSLAEDDKPLSQGPRDTPREFDTSGMTLEPAPERHSQEAD